MLPKQPRHLLYAVLLIALSIVCSSAIANIRVYDFLAEITEVLDRKIENNDKSTSTSTYDKADNTASNKSLNTKMGASAPMFSTIIQNYDDLTTCANDGRTIARFILCGDSDNRTITVAGNTSYTLYQLTGSTPDTNLACPDLNLSNYTAIYTGTNYNLLATSVPASTGAEYYLEAGGTRYYFEVIKSTITQTHTKQDYVCNNPGRIEITGLPNSYQFQIQKDGGGFGPYQSSSIFNNLDPGIYVVRARLNISGQVCEYLYNPIEIEQIDIQIDVTFTNPVCSGETGSITATVNAAVPGPYEFTLLDEFGAEVAFTAPISNNTFTFADVSEGTYAIKVETPQCFEDIPNGIPAPIQYNDTGGNPITVGTGLSPITITTTTNGMSFGCSTIPSVDIDVTPSGGSGTYSYTVSDGGNSGGTFSGTSSYTVTSPGTYTFYITDDQGCTAEKSEYVAQLDPPDVIAGPIVGTCTNGGGKVDFTIIDPMGFNLEFRATNNAGDPFTTSPTIPVPDGTYNIVEVQYSQGAFSCVLALPPVTVTSTGGLNGSASYANDYTCPAGGTINFTPTSGGSGSGYEYSVLTGVWQSGTSFTGLAPGTYIPQVRDDAGCVQDLAPITIPDPVPPTSIDFVQDQLDCATGTSRVTVNITPGGYPVTQFEIVASNPVTALPPPNATGIFPGLALDTSYQFEITNDQGCVYPASFTTGGVSTIRAQVKSGGDRKVCPGASDGSGAFLIDGFATDYDYTITFTPLVGAPATHSSGSGVNNFEIAISGLAAGNYEIAVTDNDTNCISTASFDVVEPATPLNVTANVTDMSCQNGNIGRIQANGSGGFGGYKYQLEWPSGTIQGPKTGTVFGGLTEPGDYYLTIIDSENCSYQTTAITLTEKIAPTISLGTVDYCYSATNNAEITVNSVAGTAALATHQFRINGGPLQAGPAGTYTFSNLVPGNYNIEVVDGDNCSASLTTVTIPPQLQVTLDVNSEIPCGGDGEMEITVTGGDISNLAATSYTIEYESATPPAPFTPVPGHNAVPLPSGTFQYTVPFGNDGSYRVSVTDSNGCTTISEPIRFVEPTNIAATHQITGPSCGDPNSGFVEIIPTVSSGVPPFEVVFAPAGTLVADPNTPDPTLTYSFSPQTIYSGLAAGNYEYVVKDSRNCITAVVPVTVSADPIPAVDADITPIDATCTAGDLSGGVTINPMLSPGVPDYTIIVEDNFGNPFVTLNNVTPGDLPLNITDPALIPGNYQVIVLDSRGCIDIEPLVINSLGLDIVPDFSTVPAICTPGGFTVCVDIVNGTGPFLIRVNEDPASPWNNIADQPSNPPRRHCLGAVQFGVSYNVEVLDTATGCTYNEIITVPDGSGPDVTLTIDNANCYNGDVGLEYDITSGTGPYDIIITNFDTGAIVHNVTGTTVTNTTIPVPAGHYGISVMDTATDCSDGAETEAILITPRVDIIDNQNANCNELGQLTVRGSGGTPYPTGSPYLYAFVPAGTPVDDDGTLTPADPSDDFTDASTVALPGSLIGIDYDIWVKDFNDCAYRISATVIQLDPDLPAPSISVNNQCDVTPPVGGFTITVEMPGTIDTPSFTLNGVTQTPPYTPGVPTQAVFNVGSVGSYPVYVIDANGCDVDDVAEVYQVLSASGDFSTEPNCENSDGVVTINANGGSGDFSYVLSGNDFLGNPISINLPNQGATVDFTNIPPGDYQVVVTDNQVTNGVSNCTFLIDDIFRETPTQPVIDDTGETDISCFAAGDGSISASLQSGSDIDGIQEYNLYSSTLGAMPPTLDVTGRIATNISGSFLNLAPGTYVVEVVTDRNCFDREEVTIVEPPTFEIDAVAGTLTCNPNSNQFSTTTVSAVIVNPNIGNGAPYGYKINPTDSYQSSPDFLIVDNGSDQTITIYAIDSNGCEFSDSVTVLAPNNVTATITQVSAMDCENPERIRIEVTGSTNFIVEDQGSSVATVSSQTVNGPTFIEFDLPHVSGEYRLQINDVGGCTYPIEPYTVIEPVVPTVSISEAEPVGCFGDTDGALTINVANFDPTGAYEYWVYDASDPGFSGGAFGTPVAGNSNGTIDMVADGNPAIIAGLPGGNFRVVIREVGKTVVACNVFSNVATIRTPNEQLQIDTFTIIAPPGCSDDLGELTVTAIGGWGSSPYEFMLEYENPTASGFSPHPVYGDFITNGNNDRFTDLASGNYRVTVRDIEGCTNTMERFLDATPPIQADAIITRELECPTGNDAIIVAVEPGTTTPGAIGGVTGAGYQYRLVKLDPNNLDPTNPANIISSTGLQSNPDFVGNAGTGVISGGWYAIEVVSTLNCQMFTAPVEVIPPPPISPKLIQTSVPACGNIATMKIKVNNPQGGTYEYSVYGSGGPWLPINEIDPMDGNPVITGIPGTIGSSYRYDVRKVGSLSSCLARSTNGITITDADPLSLDPASPTFDISCAYEVDGRIEAVANGGTGIYEFRIYDTDPGNDAFVAESLPTYNGLPMQDFGTFENLEEGSYWISVISRQNCGVVQGPFVIDAPEPVALSYASTPVTCPTNVDGTITMNVTTPGAGLVKFAIEPNLSEFFTDPDNPETYTFTDLEGNRTYTVLAQDAQGCPQTFDIYVGTPTELQITDIQTTPETCLGFEDGTAQLTVTGGTPFIDGTTSVQYYETKIVGPGSDGSEVFVRNDNLFFPDLVGGNSYIVFVRDANGCETFVDFPIAIGVDLAAEPLIQYGCDGIFPNSTVTIEMLDTSLLPDLLFALDPIDPTDAVTAMADAQYTWGDLPAGDHTVYIYHLNGCTNSVTFTIESYDPLTLTAEKTGPNEVTALAEGGYGGYEYFFQGESTGSETVYTTNESGNVTVQVVDANGCVAVVTIPFEFTGMLEIPNFFSPNGDGENDLWYPENREFFPDIEVKIYDRYGRMVYRLDNVKKWNGTYEGNDEPLPTGDYWYVVNANDKSEQRYVGHFTLYR
ncbi:T9SS type B sorting domain-containing protein [Maribacter algicola]|uniref:T9SS type B sorting domain-containing protein n=1 Tax=Meishania litoralis TaxID=3434685 RepID=A0ACC7LN64_9FLAO